MLKLNKRNSVFHILGFPSDRDGYLRYGKGT